MSSKCPKFKNQQVVEDLPKLEPVDDNEDDKNISTLKELLGRSPSMSSPLGMKTSFWDSLGSKKSTRPLTGVDEPYPLMNP